MTTTNFTEWEKRFKLQANVVAKSDTKTIHEACQILYQRIIDRTPVGNPNLWHPPYWPKGYKPGTLKAAWQIEYKGNTVTIWNDTPYAYRVETGWSTQAPSGMMRISVLEFNQILEQVASRNKK